MNNSIKSATTALIIAALCACQAAPQRKTVASLDSSQVLVSTKNTPSKGKRSKEEIREAYWQYLNSAAVSDSSRQLALSRLAELEFEVSDNKSQVESGAEQQDEIAADYASKQLETSINLYQLSLRDYPNAKGNDKLLYQLAKAQDQIGRVDDSFDSLLSLTINYPKSIHYVESQFRIGEYQFIRSDYAEAERAYTEVIVSPKNNVFLEKALFKRGWARFKQSYFEEAIEDFEAAISVHGFTEPDKLQTAEKEQFDEYFRAMGLSFASLGGEVPLKHYFSNNPDFDYIFQTYAVISDIYLDQERYSDAVKIMKAFSSHFPSAPEIAIAQNKIVNIWKKSGYKEKLFPAIEEFYVSYNRLSPYWKNRPDLSKSKTIVDESLRKNLLLTAQYHHSQNQKVGTAESFRLANKWYSRYLTDYLENANADKVHRQYAELLLSNSKTSEALSQYEKAAFDESLILDKTAAYQSIVLSHQLHKNNKVNGSDRKEYLTKLIGYTQLYARIYPEDKDLELLISNAAKSAYENNLYEQVIELANFSRLTNDSTKSRSAIHSDIALLKAQAHFSLDEFDAAESAYRSLLDKLESDDERKKQLVDRLALSIYQQGAFHKTEGDREEAIYHFMRIAETSPYSEIASTGLYDAIAMMIEDKSWQRSVSAIAKFQNLYPKHKLSAEVTKKLSVAYLELNQDDKAAQQFEKISTIEKDRTTQMAALWQAAQLYQKQNNTSAAARAFSKYANTYKKPFAQNMEALRALVDIYKVKGNTKLKRIWRNRIIKADKNASANEKTERTLFIAAQTVLELAKEEKLAFDSQQLRAPFKKNLKQKKKSLQNAIKLFGQASSFGIAEITTESTYSIATLYADFSKALLDSERPKHLSEEELEQYNILLEDQAFPFEDKAIEFHEINLARIRSGIFDQWVTLSLAKLKQLFPTKYARKSKIEGVIRTIK